ncbi:MAG TPA: hypothetical protein VFX97_13380 [Pyrinomonadaceae bacterium]|nr:hypothetical protein [Pyrinomonadaceae bacterium]
MQPTIHLAFVDDWELSGDGSGDPHELQFAPMRKLVEIYNAHGIRGSFNAEVLQQLTFREFQDAHPELQALADEWDDSIRETFRQGHDVQLHIHPQWSSAEYIDGKWKLTGDWSILNYSAEQARALIERGKQYLENLLRPVDPNYASVSFRSGSWCIAPSPFMLTLLADFGIVFDMSIVGGVRYQTRRIELDYSNCEEDFLPYYPVMSDARQVSDKPEPIVCLPTNHFYGSRRSTLQHHVGKLFARLKNRASSADDSKASARSVKTYGHEWAQTSHDSTWRRVYDKGIVPYVIGRHLISDLAQLDYSLMTEMLESIRRRARASGLKDVPVILENHTKDLHDFSHIEQFVSDVATAADIRCVTLTEIADDLQSGRFTIKTRQPQ